MTLQGAWNWNQPKGEPVIFIFLDEYMMVLYLSINSLGHFHYPLEEERISKFTDTFNLTFDQPVHM